MHIKDKNISAVSFSQTIIFLTSYHKLFYDYLKGIICNSNSFAAISLKVIVFLLLLFIDTRNDDTRKENTFLDNFSLHVNTVVGRHSNTTSGAMPIFSF